MNGLASGLDKAEDPRRATILMHARKAFVSDGYAGTRIEPIARDAGVSTATLYSLFDGKAGLFSSVIKGAATDFTRQMAVVMTSDGPARAQLLHFATAYAEFMADPFIRAVFRLVMAERPRFRDVAMEFFEKGRSEFGGQIIGILRALDARGELKVDYPSWAAGQLMGMIEHPVFFMPLVTGDEVMPVRGTGKIAADAVETFLARYGA